MSSAAHPQRFYCHQCERNVPIAPPTSPDADVLCPLCGGGFVEEAGLGEGTNPSPHPAAFLPHPFFPFASPSFDLRHPSDLNAFFGPPSPAPAPAPSASTHFDPSNFLHDHFTGLLSGGATIQIVLEGSSASFPGASSGISLGDYFVGSGLEQLIQQLAENDPNRYGTPPAAKSAVAALPDVAVSADMMAADGGAQCAVCMDDFHLGADAKQLPCKHVFHKDCILPWLDLHSSCPVCRFELPTDDPDHGHRRGSDQPTAAAAAAAAVAASASGAPTSATPSPRVAERRFRISLPWPLRAAFGGQAESSNPTNQDPVGGSGSGSGAGNNNATDSHHGYDDLD
ncbi:E3 ubiquitin-protein ligase RING1-like [Oryza brachyantha]|uniref:E3 ubiquitin-protein ligase RING1-like n=1 Tax=Oryza brachyantha TaxID=4533 RepID=UPI001ADA413B|nr:E3 ubiquitin-protein ligase RING1-like [Oryza brachyantha]XP_040381358.1 E3 ubiquitin-protein ligase RING1-like [Oryza brachyantha]